MLISLCSHLSGYVNSQNSRIWASENPNAIHKEPLHSEKIGVWFGMSRRRITGPIFDATITAAAYMEIFNTFVNQSDDEELSIGYFQQDGATSRTSHVSMAEIQSFIGDDVISQGLWPPRSHAARLFLMWISERESLPTQTTNHRRLESKHHRRNSGSGSGRNARIFQNMARRVQSCLDANGVHFHDVVIFLTQLGKSASDFVAISSLVVKLLKKCRVR